MKKYSVLLAVLLSLVLLASCTGTPSEPDDETTAPVEQAEADGSAYPEKPITVIIPFGPGGGSDILTRAIQKYIDLDLVPINIEGAGGLVGAQEAFRADPDGYTILAHNPLNLVSQSLGGVTDEPLWKDLQMIGFMVDDYTIVTTNKETGWKTIEEVIAYAKENPGEIKWGVTGAQTISMADSLRAAEGLEIETTMVPYDGGAATRAALLGNHIQLETSTGSDIRSAVESGDVIPLVAIAPKRSPFLPDVPTLAELGIDVQSGAPRAYYAPPGIPKEALDVLVKEFKAVCESEEFIKYTEELGLEAKFVGPEEASEIVSGWYADLEPVFEKFKSQ